MGLRTKKASFCEDSSSESIFGLNKLIFERLHPDHLSNRKMYKLSEVIFVPEKPVSGSF
jgi:hypothetical protein